MFKYKTLPYKTLDLYITQSAFYVCSVSQDKRIDLPEDKAELKLENEKNSKAEDPEIDSRNSFNLIKEDAQKSINENENETLKTDNLSSNKVLKESGTKPGIRIKLSQNSIQLFDNRSITSITDVSNKSETILPTFSLPNVSPNKNINSIDESKPNKYLKISFDRRIHPIEIDNLILEEPYKKYRIYGIVGSLRLLTGWHLIVISKIKKVGSFNKKPVYHIEEINILPYDYTLSVLAFEENFNEDDSANESPKAEEPNPLVGQGKGSESSTPNLFDRLKAVVQAYDKRVEDKKKDMSPTLHERVEGLKLELPNSPINPMSDDDATPISSPGLKSISWDSASETSNLESPNKDIKQNDATQKTYAENTRMLNSINNRKSSRSEDELLEARIKREIRKLFGVDGNMYMSYYYDLTNSLQRKESIHKNENSFFEEFNNEFWWNRTIQLDFIQGNLDLWIIPIIQGYFQTELCEIDGFQFNLTVVSRRSVNRLGMRYQRRGVNECGDVANFTETEQILELKRESINHVCSFLQIRGSIPLFWSQSPYSLRPIPIMERGGPENLDAFIKHLAKLTHVYGNQLSLVNLAEQSGRESIVSSAFRNYLNSSKDKAKSIADKVELIEFDFHRETQGMNYENLSKLIQVLEPQFGDIGYYWKNQTENTTFTHQEGIFRTNCMDCLDRTNVVQSALARYVLNTQLFRLGVQEHPDKGLGYHEAFEMVINDLWANNGDAISQAYAGTSALKGDFTRTGKRNLQGLMNDATNSLSRFYLNAFKDFFTQAVLDYLQGHHRLEKFREVAETHIATEPGLEERLKKIRVNAVEVSASIILMDNETKLAGWTLLSPLKLNRVFHLKLEEKIIILTTCSIYICSFHYGLEKVIQFTRIPLEKVVKIKVGEYFLTPSDLKAAESPMDGFPPVSTDDPSCYGMVVYYLWNQQLDKDNNKSLRSREPSKLFQIMSGTNGTKKQEHNNTKASNSPFKLITNSKLEMRFIALKGVPNLIPSAKSNESDFKNVNQSTTNIIENLMDKECATSNNSFFAGHKIISTLSTEKNDSDLGETLSPYGVIQLAKDKITLAYWNRVSEVQSNSDLDLGEGLQIEEESILTADGLRKHLYPTGSTLLMTPKIISDQIVKRLTQQ